MRRAVGLDTPVPNIAAAIEHHGYIQIDPINICGRMHDLILRNRVAGYREGDLMRHLHGDDPAAPRPDRTAFEQHVPDNTRNILVAFPLDAWPHLRAEMRARTRRTGAWSGKLTPREKVLAARLLAEIRERGPMGSEDFDDNSRRAPKVWGTATLVKSTLQKLFFHGEILIAQRLNNRRRYDLAERVLPASIRARPEPTLAENARWLARLTLRQRRLVVLKRNDAALLADEIQAVAVEGCPPLYCLRSDLSLLDAVRSETELHAPHILLLAPLDPLIYDRRVTATLWNFEYTWEAYTPPHKRVRGYYALPILAGTEIVGHVDPKADRKQRKLRVVSRRLQRGHVVRHTLQEFAAFLGLRH
jgi:uncharacterized protein YcaQ